MGRALRSVGRDVRITAIDFDIVEPANVLRQNFCDVECGRNKAATLAERYSPMFGDEIEIITDPFTAGMLDTLRADTTILIGCVDNAPARRELAAALNGTGDVWWLDCGHHYDSGQVVFGSTLDCDRLREAIRDGVCSALPAAPLLHPELLSSAKSAAEPALSCEQQTLRNTQSLIVNQRGAAYATYYLARFLTGQLDSFATYFDLPAGSSLTEWITPASLRAVCA
jgi:PRTRC genetic system ThiF family protein